MKKFIIAIYYLLFQRIPYVANPFRRIGFKLRYMCVKRVLKSCGKDVVVKDHCYFGSGDRLSVGNRSELGCHARLLGNITIGDDVMMAPEVVMMSMSHNHDKLDIPMRYQGSNDIPVVIGNDVWIGRRVTILQGVHIGNHCIVGAGAVVTHSFPDYSILGGGLRSCLKQERL
jgi:maltose O-acetyltransferase